MSHISCFIVLYLVALALLVGGIVLITAQARLFLFLSNGVFQPKTFDAFLFYLPYILFQPTSYNEIILSIQFIHWFLYLLSIIVCLVLGIFGLGYTEKLISSVKSGKVSSYWLTIRFYLALFASLLLIVSLTLSVGVLQLIDEYFVKGVDKPFWLLTELILFILCVYTHKAVKQDQFDYVFSQGLQLVVGNALLMICLLFGYTITLLEGVRFNLVFSTLSVIVGFWIQKLRQVKSNNFLCIIKKYFLSSGLNPACETTRGLIMAKASLSYYTYYYFFLSYSKGFFWLHLYGKLSHTLFFNSNNPFWLFALLFLFLGVLAFKFLTVTAKYTLLEKDFTIHGNKTSLVLPIEIFLLTQKLLTPLVLIFLKSWNLHSQLREASPRGQTWFRRLLKILVNPAYCVLSDPVLAKIDVLSVSNPLDNAVKMASLFAAFFSLPAVLNMYKDYSREQIMDSTQKGLDNLAPKVIKIAESSNSPDVREAAERFKHHLYQAHSNPSLDGKDNNLSEAGA